MGARPRVRHVDGLTRPARQRRPQPRLILVPQRGLDHPRRAAIAFQPWQQLVEVHLARQDEHRAAADRNRLADLADEIVVDAIIGGIPGQRPGPRPDCRAKQRIEEQKPDQPAPEPAAQSARRRQVRRLVQLVMLGIRPGDDDRVLELDKVFGLRLGQVLPHGKGVILVVEGDHDEVGHGFLGAGSCCGPTPAARARFPPRFPAAALASAPRGEGSWHSPRRCPCRRRSTSGRDRRIRTARRSPVPAG